MKALYRRLARAERALMVCEKKDEWREFFRGAKEADEERRKIWEAERAAEAAALAARVAAPASMPTAAALPAEPPPPVHDTHEISEHMQIRPVRWRRRKSEDMADWDADDHYGKCLTEYDPLAELDEELEEVYGRR
jgi:hypothetical protein